MVILLRLSGPRQDEQLNCETPLIRLGRGRANDVTFDKDRERVVSNFHAEIRLEQGSYFLCDLQSTHGTFLNGQRITHEQLHEGDVIGLAESMGGPRLRFSRRTTGTAAVRMVDLEIPSWQDTAQAPGGAPYPQSAGQGPGGPDPLTQSQTMASGRGPQGGGSPPGWAATQPFAPELPPPPAFLPELELDASDAAGVEPREHTIAVRRRPGAPERSLAPLSGRGGGQGPRPPVPSELGVEAWQGAPTNQEPHPDFFASEFSPPLEATSVSHSRSTTEVPRQLAGGWGGEDPFLGAQVEATHAAFSPGQAPPPSVPPARAWNAVPGQPMADTVPGFGGQGGQFTDPFGGLGSIPGPSTAERGGGALSAGASQPVAGGWQQPLAQPWDAPMLHPGAPGTPGYSSAPPSAMGHAAVPLSSPGPVKEGASPFLRLKSRVLSAYRTWSRRQGVPQSPAQTTSTMAPSAQPAPEDVYRPQTAKNLVRMTSLERNEYGGLKPFVLEEALKEKPARGQWSLPTFLLVLAVVFGLPVAMYRYGDEIMLRFKAPQTSSLIPAITARGLTDGPIEPPGIANPVLIQQAQALRQRHQSRPVPEAIRASKTIQFMRPVLHALGEDVTFVPKELGEAVQKEVDRIKKRKDFLMLYRRSQRERPELNAILGRYHLPEEYSFLPWVLSGYQAGFRSAEEDRAGLWALTPEVARRHGLTVTRQKDERLDVEKSTLAATSYCLELLGELQGQSFTLALASYQEGPFAARRLLSRQAAWQPQDITLWTFLNSAFLTGAMEQLLVQVLAVGTVHAAPEFYGLPEEQE